MRLVPRLLVLVLCAGGLRCATPSMEDAGSGGGGAGGGGGGGGAQGGGAQTGGGLGGVDAGGPGTGDAGVRCESASACASGNCVAWFRDAGAVCGRGCLDQGQCADLPDFVCIPALDGSGVCVPRSPAHCLLCEFDVDCGGLSEVCVLAPGDAVQTCRVDCSLAGAAACPPDYLCTQTRFNNQPRSFCVPPGDRCDSAQAGFCERFPGPQPCRNENDAGACEGNRRCVGGRFTTCDAQAPQCRATCEQALRPGCDEALCAAATSVPTHCGACGVACPGAGLSTTNVTCSDGGCTYSCKGQGYDVDQLADSGCEQADAPLGNHQASSATALGAVPCNDASTISAMGLVPSDRQVHENPVVTAFSPDAGAAPDFLAVSATGGTFCVNDIAVQLAVTGASNLACFQLVVSTNNGSWSCTTNAAGTCSVTQGSGSYSGGTTISLGVSRSCSAAPTLARYTVSGHF